MSKAMIVRRVQHDCVQMCTCTIPMSALPRDSGETQAERDSLSDVCSNCGTEFADPEHGRFARCPCRGVHVCRFDQ